ncbi:MAG: hypothetical protein AB1512_26300 [Thermodesulfobacteriota bacterium]
MPKRTYPRLQSYLVCDDIREEQGNKTSLIGVYNAPVTLVPIPSIIPKLCFRMVFRGLKPGQEIGFQVLDPEGKAIVGVEPRPMGIQEGQKITPRSMSIVNLIFAGVNIEKGGTYRLVVSFGPEEDAKREIKFGFKKKQ